MVGSRSSRCAALQAASEDGSRPTFTLCAVVCGQPSRSLRWRTDNWRELLKANDVACLNHRWRPRTALVECAVFERPLVMRKIKKRQWPFHPVPPAYACSLTRLPVCWQLAQIVGTPLGRNAISGSHDWVPVPDDTALLSRPLQHASCSPCSNSSQRTVGYICHRRVADSCHSVAVD